MKSSIGIAALSIFLLASCQTEGPRALAKKCEKPNDTKITVQDGTNPVVDQDPIYVCAKKIKITWYIDPSQTSQYELREDSIVIKDPDGEFTNCKGKTNGGEVGPNKDTIKCEDNNGKNGQPRRPAYKYNINVYAVGSPSNAPPVATYDPSIMND